MDYLVSPAEETDWRIDPAELEAALRARWELVRYHPNAEHDMFAFDFDLAVGGGLVDGGFARDGKVLGLGGDVNLVARVAVWFRELVPAEQSLLFYDQMYNGHVELTPGMSAAQLAEAYLASEAA
jgi:hypothetical protein